ncbi:MAG: phage tail tube protein [Planctomycetota bacterium]
MTNAVGGILYLRLNGQQRRAKGNFTYNLGRPMREAVVGADAVHGYKETPQPAFIEGATTDTSDLVLEDLVQARDITVTLELPNGKTIALYEAWFAGEGSVTTEEGEVALRFEGVFAEEIAS